ncbi:MAG: YkgJ family cysteine cluster protein [Acidobacteriota bacterium]|nr:YkgJ family cysteine cluster protein [Acidobacteriota bacterium]
MDCDFGLLVVGGLDNFVTELKKLYQAVDRQTALLERRHAARLNCRRGCSACCVDDITVFEVEAENIRRKYPDLLENELPHAAGKCAFLDESGACRIYDARPYVCRTQGLPLRWLEENEDEIYELRDICPLNEAGEAVEDLNEEDCWTIGETEANLSEMQFEKDRGEMRRIRLRDLFVKK